MSPHPASNWVAAIGIVGEVWVIVHAHAGITRRTTIRTAAAALLAAGGAALAGCGNTGATAGNASSSTSGPLPVPQSGVTKIT